MLGLRMLTMAFILCLTLTFNDVTKAQDGSVYCDTCFHQYFSTSSHFISGALVAVECGADDIHTSGVEPRFRKEVKTDVKGKFRVILPFSTTKHVNEIKSCSVKLISSSESDCIVPAISTATSSSIRLKLMKNPKKHVFSTGFFTFQPLEQPKRCQWESHANANDETIASPPLPSPVVDSKLAHWNRFGRKLGNKNNIKSSHPVNQIQPSFPFQQPPRSIFTQVVPPPPDTMLGMTFQPPPDSMLNTGFQPPPDSMFNTGFQPPPDSMMNTGFQPPPDSRINTGFQPPPDSMMNTGFQPPPDSMINTGFQPPPDSMMNTGFQPPPDSMINTGFQPPPDSMTNIGFHPPPDSMLNTGLQPPPADSMFNPNPLQPPPFDSAVDQSPPSLIPHLPTPPAPLSPSMPSPPVDSQPDLVQATPPPPADPVFPPFPFQPSAGLPRMPPRTDKPPLLYK